MLKLSVQAQEALALHRSYQEAAYSHRCPHTKLRGAPSLVQLSARTAVGTGEVGSELMKMLPPRMAEILASEERAQQRTPTLDTLCCAARDFEPPAVVLRCATAPTPQTAQGVVQDSGDALRRSWVQRSRNLPPCIWRYQEALHATFYGRQLSQPAGPAPTTAEETSIRTGLQHMAAAESYHADEDARRVRIGVQRCFSSPSGRAMELFSPADVLALIDLHNAMLYGSNVTRALPQSQRVLGRQLAESVELLSAEFQRALFGELTGFAPRPEDAGAAPEDMPCLQTLQRIVPLAPVSRLEFERTLERATAWAAEPLAEAAAGRAQPREPRLGGGNWL